MSEATQNIIHEFKNALQQLYGERLAKVILFGSYARGEANEDSDIDFLVVLKDKNISVFNEIENINSKIYNLILQSGKLISFVPTTEDKLENTPNHFYTLVKQEGKTV